MKAGAVGFISIAGSPLDEGEDLVPALHMVCRKICREKRKKRQEKKHRIIITEFLA